MLILAQAGTYTVTYTVSDAAGNQATETRTVNVVNNNNNPTTHYIDIQGFAFSFHHQLLSTWVIQLFGLTMILHRIRLLVMTEPLIQSISNGNTFQFYLYQCWNFQLLRYSPNSSMTGSVTVQ